MSLATRLVAGYGLLFGLVLAWVIWLERWKARNGIPRQSASGDSGGGDGGWFFGGGDGCGSDGGGDGGGGCD
jgi:hypothetical protein